MKTWHQSWHFTSILNVHTFRGLPDDRKFENFGQLYSLVPNNEKIRKRTC